MIDTIIFDVGGVLVKVDNDYVKNDISKTLEISPDIVEKAWNQLIPKALGKGKITESEFWKKFMIITKSEKKLPKESLLSRQYVKRFFPCQEMLELVHRLKKANYKLGIISDTIANQADVVKKKGIFDVFDKVVLSYKVGLRKPNQEIFKLALKRLNSKPEETVFIDDIKKYVDASRKLGINGILFKDTHQLEKQLKMLGVKL